MYNVSKEIKEHLEAIYDIPICVNCGSEYNDINYKIWPENDLGELFEIKMLYRQGIRLIIDICPQKYAAGMLADMQHAEKEKVEVFLKYVDIMRRQNAKIEMSINQNLCTHIDESIWKYAWKNLRIRISVIPEKDDENYLEKRIFVDWAGYAMGMMLSLLNIEKMEIVEKLYLEGGHTQVLTNKYERNPVNRQLCLLANGYVCKICGFDFEKQYGKIGYKFIHVHHIEKISAHDAAYHINPEEDLIPVCPNCHAMLHREEPPIRPEKLIEIIQFIRNNEGD